MIEIKLDGNTVGSIGNLTGQPDGSYTGEMHYSCPHCMGHGWLQSFNCDSIYYDQSSPFIQINKEPCDKCRGRGYKIEQCTINFPKQG